MMIYVHKETGVKIQKEQLIELIEKHGPMAEVSFHMRGPIITEEIKNGETIYKGSIISKKYNAYKIFFSEDFKVIKEETEFTLEELMMMNDSIRNTYRDLPESKNLSEKLHKRIANIYRNRY